MFASACSMRCCAGMSRVPRAACRSALSEHHGHDEQTNAMSALCTWAAARSASVRTPLSRDTREALLLLAACSPPRELLREEACLLLPVQHGLDWNPAQACSHLAHASLGVIARMWHAHCIAMARSPLLASN